METYQTVSVSVPSQRVVEFYDWYSRWLRGNDLAAPVSHERSAWDPTSDLELAKTAWRLFPNRARLVFGTLIDHPGERFSGDELAELHNIPNGKYGTAGAMAWPGRRLGKLDRSLPCENEPDDGPTGGSLYWMKPEVAALFRAARDGACELKTTP